MCWQICSFLIVLAFSFPPFFLPPTFSSHAQLPFLSFWHRPVRATSPSRRELSLSYF